MKTAAMIARYLLGLGFVVFGLNGFLISTETADATRACVELI